ncbi:MAG TPA: presqualene diphosphate synthase HpnD [Candidatus Eisenbacteria bacterium]|nr:presqualene diphosphate synthase HpnD [Candidatus Eisenbacteria bacterium]
MTPSPRRRSNFGVAFALLPPDQRRAIRAVHAWSRAVDDSVDEEPDLARAESLLARWRAELAALYERTPSDPVTLALEPHVRRFDLPRTYFEELIAGVEMDLTHARYDTFADLERYCYRVASVVGLICLRIFGDRDERGRAYAESLGLALQLTNILRDVGGDHAKGRIYLPSDERRRFGYSEEALARGERNEAFRQLMRHQAERARRYFDAAEAERRTLDRRRYLAAEIMGRVYRRLLEKIEASDFDVFRGEVRVRRVERVWIAATTAASAAFRA